MGAGGGLSVRSMNQLAIHSVIKNNGAGLKGAAMGVLYPTTAVWKFQGKRLAPQGQDLKD